MSDDKPPRKRNYLATRPEYTPDRFRMLPASPDAEQGILCSMLLAPSEVGAICAEMGVSSEWFHSPAYGTIYGVIMEFWEKNIPIDQIQLLQALYDRGILDQVGGPAFLSSLFTAIPTAANVVYYLTIAKEKMALRKLIQVGTEFASRAYDEQSEVWDIVDEFEQKALQVRPSRLQKILTGPKTAVMEAMTNIALAYESRGSITGLSTGFEELDRQTDGMHKTEFIVIAARPSHGKTALAMNIAEHIALKLKLPVGIFSLEMSTAQLIQRMLCSRAKVNMQRVRDGFLSERDFPNLTIAAGELAESPMYIDDTPGLSIQELRARARRMKQQFGIVALFVDYLQLLRSDSKKSQDNRQLEVSEVSAGLKNLAKELDIPIVALCQLGREFEKRGGVFRPRLSDLRESGSIEQDADVIHMLTRPELFADNPEDRDKLRGIAELIIAKQRSGPIADIALTFLKEFTRFETRAGCEELQAEVNNQQPQLLPYD